MSNKKNSIDVSNQQAADLVSKGEAPKPTEAEKMTDEERAKLAEEKALAEKKAKAGEVERLLKSAMKAEEKAKAGEREAKAKKDAKAAKVENTSSVAAFLLARNIVEDEGRKSFYDFSYKFIDENGVEVMEYGRMNVTAVMGEKAAKAFREAAKKIKSAVVPYKQAENDEGRANVRKSVSEEFKTIFTYLGVPVKSDDDLEKRKNDCRAILSGAYEIDCDGDDDAKGEGKIIQSACYVARRILTGREAAKNAEAAKAAKKAAKAEAAKTEGVKQAA